MLRFDGRQNTVEQLGEFRSGRFRDGQIMLCPALLNANFVDQFEQLAFGVGDRLESLPFELKTRAPLRFLFFFVVKRFDFHCLPTAVEK